MIGDRAHQTFSRKKIMILACTGTSVAEPRYFYAAPAPGKNFDAALAPTLFYSKAKFLKRTKV
jgi:hypothetical protein